MFILENSLLLEDTINDPTVLSYYKLLRKYEASNERLPLIEGIISSDKCISLTELLVKFYELNGFSLDQATCNNKFTTDQRDEIVQELKLDIKEVASLALVVSAALTQLFVIDNFTGPNNNEVYLESYKDLPEIFKTLRHKIGYQSLSNDGSEVYHLVSSPWLLKTVQLYWNFLSTSGCSRRLLELEFLVWKHRYLTIHLMILLEPTELLINELRKIQEFIFDHHIINEAKENNTELVRFNTVELCSELIESALLRDSITSCRKFFDYASDIAELTIEHTGVLGKRTKFQQKDVPQLVVKVNHVKKSECSLDADNLPKDVILDDDTLLPEISFIKGDDKGSSPNKEDQVSLEAQLLLLSKLDVILKSEVMEESLKDEWTSAYLSSIIKNASIWSVKYKALSLRSMVEKKHMRKMDRALTQMEELIKTVESPDATQKRLRSFYSVLPLSSWQMQRSLGDISFGLGLYKNALEVYLKIEYWEGIIKCYSALDQTVKAEKVIRQELAKQETPYLYCLLGDVTEDIRYYEQAWSTSKCKFARAKKSIGTYLYVRKEYAAAIENYELALSVNPSNVSILSLLAYCCLITERYERAAECYRNITYIDDSSYLAWNNLSKAYIKLGQKERAWRTLREAIKCNYEEWKIWENLMIVAIDIGALDDVIVAWHRIIDLKSSHKDDQMLSALTYQLTNIPINKFDSEQTKLLTDGIKLVARINSTGNCSSTLWICYYKLLIKEFELASNCKEAQTLTKSDIDSKVNKITTALQRATPTALLAESHWYQAPDKIVQILDSFDELVDCYIFAFDIVGQRPELLRQWKSFKLSIDNIMKMLDKKCYRSQV